LNSDGTLTGDHKPSPAEEFVDWRKQRYGMEKPFLREAVKFCPIVGDRGKHRFCATILEGEVKGHLQTGIFHPLLTTYETVAILGEDDEGIFRGKGDP